MEKSDLNLVLRATDSFLLLDRTSPHSIDFVNELELIERPFLPPPFHFTWAAEWWMARRIGRKGEGRNQNRGSRVNRINFAVTQSLGLRLGLQLGSERKVL